MKLSPEALLEIVHIFQNALMNGQDASGQMREIDLAENSDGQLTLSYEYLQKYPRAAVWPDQDIEEV